jgi:tetratricopeptide (TPR) repeat protein
MKTLQIAIVTLLLASASLSTAGTQSQSSQIQALETALKANPNDPKGQFDLGVLLFDQAAGGDKDAVDKAAGVFEKLIKQDPKNAEYHCRYGSILTMKGRDAWIPLLKARLVNNGLEEMDKAVALAPDDVAVRLTRANTCYALPDIFNRIDTTVGDCRYLSRLFEKNPAAYSESVRMKVRLLLASSLKKSGKEEESKRVLEKIIAESPGSTYAEEARKMLEKS